MTIQTNNIITYKDLINKTIDYIVANCSNVGSISSMVNGYANNTHPGDWNSKNIGNNTMLTLTVSDSILQTVTRATIETQLNNFLKSRNLYVAENTEISYKSLINYISNISAFVCARMLSISNPFSTKTEGYVIYSSSYSTPGAITNIKNLDIYKADVKSNVNRIVNVNSLKENAHVIKMNIAYNCSSSSSSCSSSSCSSSSSCFIAYMIL